MSEQTTLLTALAGACAGILPIILLFFLRWLTQRGMAARKAEAVTLAKERVEFLTGWIVARQALGPDGKLSSIKQSVRSELDEIWESVVELDASTSFDTPSAKRSLLQRLFLLCAPVTLAGWIYHILYGAALGSLSGLVLLVTYSLLSPNAQTIAINLYASIFSGILSLVLALLFRWLAVSEDHQAEKQARLEWERRQARHAKMSAAPEAN